MNQTEATLNFDTIELTGDGYAKITQLNGNEWKTYLWGYSSRGLRRNVLGGEASISESSNGKFMVQIEVQPCVARARLEKTFWGTLLEAVEFAETFTWEIKEHAGYRWYKTSDRTETCSWVAVIGEGNTASLFCGGDGEYYMKRNISPRSGECYEICANRYDSSDSKHAVRTFEEAAAIVIALPSFLSVLGA